MFFSKFSITHSCCIKIHHKADKGRFFYVWHSMLQLYGIFTVLKNSGKQLHHMRFFALLRQINKEKTVCKCKCEIRRNFVLYFKNMVIWASEMSKMGGGRCSLRVGRNILRCTKMSKNKHRTSQWRLLPTQEREREKWKRDK